MDLLVKALWLDKKFSVVGILRFLLVSILFLALTLVYLVGCPEADAYQIFQGPPAGKFSDTTMIETCTTVISSAGGEEPFGYNFAVDTGITGASVTTTPRAIISIRPKATFNGIINRSDVDLLTYGIVAVAQNVRCRIMYNVTFTGTPVWVSADANSMVEYSLHNDVSAGAFTGGTQVQPLYGISGQGQSAGSPGADLDVAYPLALDHAGANPTSISLTCTAFTGTATVNALMNWLEER